MVTVLRLGLGSPDWKLRYSGPPNSPAAWPGMFGV